jgi:hypothetical protein
MEFVSVSELLNIVSPSEEKLILLLGMKEIWVIVAAIF